MKILSLSPFSVNQAILLLAVAAGFSFVHADDWPVLRGPERDGISNEEGLAKVTSAEVAWEKKVGLGYGAPVVGGGKVVIAGHDGGEKDTLFCFDEVTGDEKWKFSYPQPLADLYFQGGTTGTATINGDRVYQIAREGELFCLDAEKGKVVWSTHLKKEFKYEKPDWGFTGAPFVHGDHLLINAGESGLVLNRQDGSVVWKSETGKAGYSTPYVFEKNGTQYAIFSNEKYYVCVEAANGNTVWSHKWMTRYGVNAADPIVAGNHILIASGYGKGAELLQWSGSGEPKRVWKSRELKTQMNAALLMGGYLYAIDGDEGKDMTSLKCLKFETGETLWTEESVGHGTVSAAGDQLIVLTEKGELQIAMASPEGYEPHFKKQVLDPKVWTVPVFANGKICCRNASGQFIVLSVK
ncbi:PQQ-binding-like beta-propeller repeat protein [Verrucomicrobiales bacterium]|nr:PQQ-binding-like beta-propeller repeat protein [Verrucomicrobiales bacterium]